MLKTIEQPLLPLKLNLQHFAGEDTHPFADPEPVSVEPHPFAEAPEDSPFSRFTDQPNPLMEMPPAPDTPQVQPQGQGEPAQQPDQLQQAQPPAEEYLDFSGRKVKAYDEDVKGLHQDYTQLNRTYQQTNQELLQARQLLDQYQTVMQQQAQAPQQPQAPQNQGVAPERMQQLNEQYMERMYENKFEADQWWAQQPEVQAMEQQRMADLVNQQVQEIVGPIQQERAYQQQVSAARNKYADFDDQIPTIQQLVQQQPHLADLPDSMEVLYTMAKGLNAAPAPSLDQMLVDPQYQQQIVQNEQIRNMILQNYSQGKQQVNQQTPPVMGAPNRAQVPSSLGERKPRSISEASAMYMNWSGKQ